MNLRGITFLGLASTLLLTLGTACSDGGTLTNERRTFTGGTSRNPDAKVDPALPSDADSKVSHNDAPIQTQTGQQETVQKLAPADIYCSDDTVKLNGNWHFLNSQRIMFRFYDDRSNIFSTGNSVSTKDLRTVFAGSKLLQIPVFVGLPDGDYDLLLCEESKADSCYVNFDDIFEFTPYEAVFYGKARGLVGIIRKVRVADGRFAGFDKMSLLHPAKGHSNICTTENSMGVDEIISEPTTD